MSSAVFGSMEFLKPKGLGNAKLKQQLLSVGDAAGNLHVYDLPQNLWRPLLNERSIMTNFLDRETKVMEDGRCIAVCLGRAERAETRSPRRSPHLSVTQ